MDAKSEANEIIRELEAMRQKGIKAGNIDLSFVDRFSGTVIMTGLVSEVESAINAVMEYMRDRMRFTCCEITRT